MHIINKKKYILTLGKILDDNTLESHKTAEAIIQQKLKMQLFFQDQ